MQKFLINNWWWMAIVLLVVITAMVIMLIVANYRERKLFLEVEDQILSDQSEAEYERQNASLTASTKTQPKVEKVEQKPATAKTNLTKTATGKVAKSKEAAKSVNKKPATKPARTVKPATKTTKPTKKD